MYTISKITGRKFPIRSAITDSGVDSNISVTYFIKVVGVHKKNTIIKNINVRQHPLIADALRFEFTFYQSTLLESGAILTDSRAPNLNYKLFISSSTSYVAASERHITKHNYVLSFAYLDFALLNFSVSSEIFSSWYSTASLLLQHRHQVATLCCFPFYSLSAMK